MRPLLAFFEFSLRAIVGSLVLAIVVLVSAQVLFRYAFASPIVWSEEFTTLCYQWLSYLGAALAVRYRGHFGVDFLSRLIPRAWRGAVKWIEHGVVWFIALFMIVYGWAIVMSSAAQMYPTLGFSVGTGYLVLPIAGVLFILMDLASMMEPKSGAAH